MKDRPLAKLTALATLLLLAPQVRADVTGVSITDPTTGNPVNADAGYTFTAGVNYTADNAGGPTISLTLKLLTGTTVISQTNLTVAKQVPGGTVNVTYALANCAPNGTYALAAEATETTTAATTNSDAVIVTGGQPMAFSVTGGGAYCSGGTGVPVGLSGSEFGVNYQLKRGGVNNGSAIAGTGAAISFGNKVFPATYTVVAVDAVSGCSATMTGSAVVSVNPPSLGGTATATDTAVCSGSSTTISLSGQTGNIVEWQYSTDDGDTWTAIASTNNPLTTSALSTTTYFQAVVMNAGCSAAYSSAAGVTVYPATVGGTATPGAAAVCNGSGTSITLSGQTGAIVKWQSATNGTDWTDIPSTANPLNTGNLTVSKQFRAVVQSGSCSAENSTTATVTVSPTTVPGTATATGETICSGSGTTITLSGYTGAIVRWEASLDGLTWSPIASTSNPLSTGNLTTNTQFRAMVQSGGCTLLDSGIASVTVTPTSVGGTATPTASTVCNGTATSITLTGQTGAIVKWQSSTNGTDWSDIPSTANPLNTGNLTVTKRFRAVVLSGSCSAANSTEAIVSVSPATVPGTATATDTTVCSGSGTTLTLSGHTGSIVRWEASTDGNTWSPIASTNATLNTGNLTATKQFRAIVHSGACDAQASTSVTVTVTPASVGGTATPAAGTLCYGTTTTVTLSGQTGSIVEWQYSTNAGSTWTSIAATSNPLTTPTLTTAALVRAVVSSGGCETANSSSASIAITPASVGGTATPTAATLCYGTGTTITLSGQTGAIVKWQTSTNGSTWTDIASTANPLNTGNLTVSKRYRAVVLSGVCSAANSSEAIVTVNPATVAGTVTAATDTVCQDSGTTLTLSGQVGQIVRWESSLDGIDWSPIAATNNPLSTGNLTETTLFRAMVSSGGCDLLDSGIETVNVTPVSVGGTATPTSATLCNGTATTITLSGQTGAIVKWQTSTNGTNWTDIPSTANPLNTGNLTVSKRYRAVVLSGACSATNSTEAIVTVSPTTVPGTATATTETICSGTGTTITLSGHTGAIVRWETSLDGLTWTPIASTNNPLSTGNLTETTQFRAMVQSGGCNLLDSGSATVTVTPTSVGGTATAATSPLCNGSATSITLSGHTGSILKWQASTNGTDWTDIPSTANPLNTGNLTVTKRYRAVVLSGVCSAANSTEAIVTVYNAPSITSQPVPATKLVGESVTFSVTASNALSYQWRTNGTAISGATGSAFTINSVTGDNAADYDVVVSGESPCSTITSATATLTVGSKLVFTSEPVSTTAGATMTAVTAQIQDDSGNNVPVSGSAITLTVSGGATLPGTVTVATDSNGSATFSGLSIAKAGTGYTLTASAGSLTAATSSAFNISAATASAYRVTTASANITPGAATLLSLRLVDQYTNTITTFTGDKNLTFAGLTLANDGTTHPTVTDKTGTAIALGATTTVRFTNGLSSLGGTLLAYKAEGPATLTVTDGVLSTGTTGGLGATITVTNAPATGTTDAAVRSRNTQLRLTIASLLANDTDANRDPVQFVSILTPSTEGATIVANSTFILYSMPPGTNPATDSFHYLISDGSLTSTGIVNITLRPDPTGTNSSVIAYGVDGQNHPVLTFAGVPGYDYKVQRSQNLATWTDLFTTNMPALGKFDFTDLTPSSPAFYRAINQ